VSGDRRIVKIDLDERTVARRGPDIERERAVAIYDLLETNRFALVGNDAPGPYHLHISIVQNRLHLDIRSVAGEPLVVFGLSLSPFRKVVKDYWEICESYYEAIKTANPSRIEALDMGRRATHNDGSELLRTRLEGKIDLDNETSRRLFTLICVLHLR
jgi:uncharacterized protein (UPF0262 family)